tara:strand:- start:204 stop:482 length:279 start_codon:yes stop_codon:yes gene_type:complete
MRYFVYLIISTNKQKLTSYVGYTNNIKKRLKDHNSSKGAKFTKGRKWKLAYIKSYDTKSEAMSEEFNLKNNLKLRNQIKKTFNNENINLTSL